MTISSRKIPLFQKRIVDLADKPDLGSSALLKSYFDSSPEELRVALNGLIDDMLATAAGSSGATNIGVTAISGSSGATVQAVLESVIGSLKSSLSGTSGSEYIGSASIVGVTGNTIYDQLTSLKSLINAVYTKAQLDAGQLDNRYYTETELNAGQLDNRYFTETELQSVAPGASGADKVGSAPISGVTGSTVYAQLSNIFAQLQGIVIGTLPDGSVTPAKLSFDPATQAELDTLIADYVRQPGFAVTAGVANTYTATLAPALTAYTAGVCIAVKINVANTGASTININGLGAKSILDSKGNAMISGKLRLNGVYTLRYDGTAFILQGEGGDYGTAVAADVLTGKTIGTDTGLVNGTMPNNAGDNAALASSVVGTTLKLRAKAGFTDGVDDNVTITDADFIAANILAGKDIFGLVGTLALGKKFASGSGTFDGGSNAIVTGLTFTATCIVVYAINAGQYDRVTYLASETIMNVYWSHRASGGGFSGASGAFWSVNSTGFSAFIPAGLSGSFTYVAYE